MRAQGGGAVNASRLMLGMGSCMRARPRLRPHACFATLGPAGDFECVCVGYANLAGPWGGGGHSYPAFLRRQSEMSAGAGGRVGGVEPVAPPGDGVADEAGKGGATCNAYGRHARVARDTEASRLRGAALTVLCSPTPLQ